jgi:peptide/nickel transport system substrate-binding protein
MRSLNRSGRLLSVLSVMLILSFVLSGCGAAATPTAAPAPKAAPTAAPAAPAAPAAAAPTAAPTKAPAAAAPAAAPSAAPAAAAPAAAATTAPAAAAGAVPTKFSEAPALADQVKAGKLPAVEKRLPDVPYLEPTAEVGKYGGIWHRGFLGPSDFNGVVRVMNDGLVRFSTDGTKVEMKVAESVTPNAAFTEWTIKLRKGAKWSNGTAMTSDDIMFWWKDVINNKELTPSMPTWLQNGDLSTITVDKIDDLSVKFTYKTAMTTFLEEIAQKDNGDRLIPMFLPSVYLKPFHATYAAKADLDKLVADAKMKTWTELFIQKQNSFENVDRPVMSAWKSTNRISDQIFTFTRNPYYVGVDSTGQQLPYMDEVQFKFFADAQALNLAAIAGELDEQERHVNLTNFPVLKENEAKLGKYHLYLWSSTGGGDADIIFNLTSVKDPEMTKIFNQLDYRKAVSMGINRQQIQEAAFLGTGEPRQSIIKKGSPWYPGDEYAKMYTEYKPDDANKLLDGLGLTKKNADGIRLRADGKTVEFELSVVPAFGPWPDIAQMIAKDMLKLGIKVNVQVRERDLHFQMRQANELQAEVWNQDSSGTMFSGSTKYDIRLPVYGNFTYGPLYKTWYDTKGAQGVEPPQAWKDIVAIQDKAKAATPDEKVQLAQQIYKMWAQNLFDIGTVGLTAMDQGVVVVNNNLKNVPQNLTKDWALRTPGNGKPETWFYAK